MTTTYHLDPTVAAAPREPMMALHGQLRDRLQSRCDAPGSLVRAEIRLDVPSPLNWLQGQRSHARYYWSSRDGEFEMAGIGEADVLVPESRIDAATLFSHMRRRLSGEWPNLRYYGGFRFGPTGAPSSRWRNFKAYRFIVPQVEVVRCGDTTWLAYTVRCGAPEHHAELLSACEAELAALTFPDDPLPSPLPPLAGRLDLPDRSAWDVLVERALDAFAHHRMEKVVLARETQFQFDGESALDPVNMLRRLLRHTDRSYEFCFQPTATRAFLGASPERLFYRKGLEVRSEALAGTRPRGRDATEDAALGRALLDSEKDLREHRFVARTLRDQFTRFCVSMTCDDSPSLMRLRNVQHLYTYMEGVLKNRDVDAALVETFHPTPAVGGAPKQKALDWLAENEPFDRGVYAAPVGWIGYDDAEFCVGIRSGLIEGTTLALYSGAGIVPGSRAEEEWDEIENKMSNFLEALYDPPA